MQIFTNIYIIYVLYIVYEIGNRKLSCLGEIRIKSHISLQMCENKQSYASVCAVFNQNNNKSSDVVNCRTFELNFDPKSASNLRK